MARPWKARKYQAGMNLFEMAWFILIISFIAIGGSLGHQHIGGIWGLLIGMLVGAVAGIILVAVLRFLTAFAFKVAFGGNIFLALETPESEKTTLDKKSRKHIRI